MTEKFDYDFAYIDGLNSAIKHVNNAREFLRGSSYSTDRLVNMIINSIQEEIKDINDDTRQLCNKTK